MKNKATNSGLKVINGIIIGIAALSWYNTTTLNNSLNAMPDYKKHTYIESILQKTHEAKYNLTQGNAPIIFAPFPQGMIAKLAISPRPEKALIALYDAHSAINLLLSQTKLETSPINSKLIEECHKKIELISSQIPTEIENTQFNFATFDLQRQELEKVEENLAKLNSSYLTREIQTLENEKQAWQETATTSTFAAIATLWPFFIP